ncbi:MAG: tripartite tricarboxylate transporter substrate binding protein [Proteobacteria bacterium]|nr:tripartite tricarboxylate transporter substrate binding protein [Pseudomonadota bacterium]
MPILARRSLLAAATAAPFLLTGGRGFGQAWPARPIRYVVPFAAGAGILDIMARIVAQHLSETIGQQVVVDNRPGAGGNVGADIVAKAAPDGYTIMMGNTALVVAPNLFAHMTFDPMTDLVPVTMVNSAPLMLVVHPSLPVKTVTEFVAYAKQQGGKLNYGSGGIGTTPFLAVELLKSMAGFDAVHVPYKGGAPALADLVAGQIAFMIENVPGTLPFVKDGKLRALGISSAKRLPLVPDLPTIQEAGVPGYEMIGWNGIFVPKGTPADVQAKLHDALAKILKSDAAKKQLADLGAEAIGNPQPEFAAFVKQESTRWSKIIREKGIKPE